MTAVTVKDVTDAVYDRYGGRAPTIGDGVNLSAIVMTVIDVLDELGFPVKVERTDALADREAE